MTLLEPFRQFLAGTKTTERVTSQELLDAISVDTGLENIVVEALRAGRDVVVTGSAGGGKTQLTRRVVGRLAKANPPLAARAWDDPDWASVDAIPAVQLIADLTATPSPVRAQALTRMPGATGLLLAANEGTLASLNLSPLGDVIGTLHQMQQGDDPDDSGQPVVVDLGGYNPFSGAFEEVLRLDLLNELIGDCCEDRDVCPRWLSWQLLRLPAVASRLNELITRALGPTEVLFREVWDLIADLALQGDCEATLPTSPWFWRVFYGGSALSRRLRAVADPSVLALPEDEIRLFYGDWAGVAATPFEGGEFLWLSVAPSDVQSDALKASMMAWLKAELALTSAAGHLVPRFGTGSQQEIDVALHSGNPESLIEALNRYYTYSLSPTAARNALDLWFDLSIERRQRRPQGSISLGTIPRGRVSIRRSVLVGNAGEHVFGARVFLATDAGASLRLDERLVATLTRGRSVRVADRRHDDVDWAIGRFYVESSTNIAPEALTRIATLTFSDDFREFELHQWSLDPLSLTLEPA